jgi:hypothetical protein
LKAWLLSYEFGGVYIEGFGELADSPELGLRIVSLNVGYGALTHTRLIRKLVLRQEPPRADVP